MNVRMTHRLVTFLLVLLVAPICLGAEPDSDTAIIVGPHVGEPTAEAPIQPRKQRDWKVRNTSVRQVGGRSVTIQEVEPPILEKATRATTPAPRQAAPTDTPNTVAQLPMRVIGITATIYGRGNEKRTRLTINTQRKTFYAWSNIDFRHMDGLVAFRANGREYFLIMGHDLARDDRGRLKTLRDATLDGCPRKNTLASTSATFALVAEQNSRSPLAREILHDIHTLYRQEKQHLTDAFNHRQRTAAHPKPAAPPSPPKPVTIRFWKRDLSKQNAESRAR